MKCAKYVYRTGLFVHLNDASLFISQGYSVCFVCPAEPIGQVLLTLEPEQGEFFEGDDLTLHCDVQVGGGIWYMWLLDGVELEETSNPLHIRGLTQEDAGSYSCVAISKMEQQATKMSNNVTVMVRGHVSLPGCSDS